MSRASNFAISFLGCIASFYVLLSLFSSSAIASVPVTDASLPQGVITAIRLHDESGGGSRAVAFGLPLPEGIVNEGDGLIVTTAAGQELATQWSPLSSWRTDGSVLHGVTAFLPPEGGTNGGIYYVKKVDVGSAGEALTKADIVSAGFSAGIAVVIGGNRYELQAEDLLTGAVPPRLDYTHFTGPIASEFVVGGPLRLAQQGTPHETLQAYFYLRAFKRPVEQIYVTVVLENTGAFNTLTDIPAESVEVRVDGQLLEGFPKSPFTIHADIRYPKRAWWRGIGDGHWVQHDTAYVSSTKLMPAYRTISLSESALAGYAQESEWNEKRILSNTNLEGGGAKPELAPHDRWTAAYMVTGDKRAWNAMRTAVDEYGMMVSNFGDGVVHARDEETGLPLDLTKKGVVGQIWFQGGGTDVLNASRDGRPVAQTDIAHWPSIGYLTYLLTGEANEMENVQHSAVQVWLNEAPGGHKGTIPGRPVRWLQVRGMAWALREMINGAVVTPDHHPLRYALQTSATYALQEYSAAGQADDPTNLGLWFPGLSFVYDDGTGVATWMDDYLTWAVGDAFERGWRQELIDTGFWQWKSKGTLGRMGTSATDAFCWEYAARYKLKVRPTSSDATFGSWAEVFAENHPDVTACAAPGQSTIGPGDRDAVDYGAQMAAALAVAASTGVSGGDRSWQIYDSRQKSWSFGYDQAPEWAVTSRLESVRPGAPRALTAD